MPHFKLTLAYDGTGLVGWQRQASGTSVQGLIEEALGDLDGAPVAVAGAGRTDAGVHALGQVASLTLRRSIDGATLLRAVNARLPPTVRVIDAREAAPDFHARFSARSKIYRYRIWNGVVVPPFEHPFVWHVSAPTLDLDAMSAAAAAVEGRHDFSAFQGAGTDVQSSERTIVSSRVQRHPVMIAGRSGDSPLVAYEVRGDGFLRHMVRTIVGSLVDVGRGRQSVDWMADVLASKSRARAGATAPASGLFLVGVEYREADL